MTRSTEARFLLLVTSDEKIPSQPNKIFKRIQEQLKRENSHPMKTNTKKWTRNWFITTLIKKTLLPNKKLSGVIPKGLKLENKEILIQR